tara:strand:+ start:1503 stop:1667 length:165 start_codon:yes stop_codon:yes gene_type:complete
MKHLIKKVLDRYKDRQINLGSESAREHLASEIEVVLIQDKQVRKLQRELYKGEG